MAKCSAWRPDARGARGQSCLGDTALTPVARVVAHRDAGEGPKVIIYEGVAEGSLLLRPEMLDVLEPGVVLVSLDPETAANAAYVAITLRDPTGRQRSFSLEAGESAEWRCWAATRFDLLTYEYRLQHIPRMPDGATLPLVTGEWQRAGDPTPERDPAKCRGRSMRMTQSKECRHAADSVHRSHRQSSASTPMTPCFTASIRWPMRRVCA